MKNSSLFITAMLALCSLTARADFSVDAWSQDLKSSLETGKPALRQLLDLKSIEKQVFTNTSPDSKIMEKARLLFAQEKFAEALTHYEMISKASPYWLEAVEEKAWTYHRLQDFEKSLAQTKTLLSEPLISVIGSEPFFLQALSQLKICDYASVLKSNKLYKETQKERVLALEDLATKGTSSSLDKVVEKANRFPLSFSQIGAEAKSLPRLFYTDHALQMSILRKKLATIAVVQLEAQNKPEFSGVLASLKKGIQGADQKMQAQMKAMAQVEVGQNQKMLQKLSLVEVETIQRMHADKEMDPKSFHKGAFVKLSDNDLSFPDDGNPWMDELDKYQVKANTCPRNIRRKM